MENDYDLDEEETEYYCSRCNKYYTACIDQCPYCGVY